MIRERAGQGAEARAAYEGALAADSAFYGARFRLGVLAFAAPDTTTALAMMERAINNSSGEGDLVLDLFLGSGSTLIACERVGRRCAGLELDPQYAEIAIRRWEAFTGETAVIERRAERAGSRRKS